MAVDNSTFRSPLFGVTALQHCYLDGWMRCRLVAGGKRKDLHHSEMAWIRIQCVGRIRGLFHPCFLLYYRADLVGGRTCIYSTNCFAWFASKLSNSLWMKSNPQWFLLARNLGPIELDTRPNRNAFILPNFNVLLSMSLYQCPHINMHLILYLHLVPGIIRI